MRSKTTPEQFRLLCSSKNKVKINNKLYGTNEHVEDLLLKYSSAQAKADSSCIGPDFFFDDQFDGSNANEKIKGLNNVFMGELQASENSMQKAIDSVINSIHLNLSLLRPKYESDLSNNINESDVTSKLESNILNLKLKRQLVKREEVLSKINFSRRLCPRKYVPIEVSPKPAKPESEKPSFIRKGLNSKQEKYRDQSKNIKQNVTSNENNIRVSRNVTWTIDGRLKRRVKNDKNPKRLFLDLYGLDFEFDGSICSHDSKEGKKSNLSSYEPDKEVNYDHKSFNSNNGFNIWDGNFNFKDFESYSVGSLEEPIDIDIDIDIDRSVSTDLLSIRHEPADTENTITIDYNTETIDSPQTKNNETTTTTTPPQVSGKISPQIKNKQSFRRNINPEIIVSLEPSKETPKLRKVTESSLQIETEKLPDKINYIESFVSGLNGLRSKRESLRSKISYDKDGNMITDINLVQPKPSDNHKQVDNTDIVTPSSNTDLILSSADDENNNYTSITEVSLNDHTSPLEIVNQDDDIKNSLSSRFVHSSHVITSLKENKNFPIISDKDHDLTAEDGIENNSIDPANQNKHPDSNLMEECIRTSVKEKLSSDQIFSLELSLIFKAFKVLDVDGDGFLTTDNFMEYLKNKGANISKNYIADIIWLLDDKTKGSLIFEDVKNYYMRVRFELKLLGVLDKETLQTITPLTPATSAAYGTVHNYKSPKPPNSTKASNYKQRKNVTDQKGGQVKEKAITYQSELVVKFAARRQTEPWFLARLLFFIALLNDFPTLHMLSAIKELTENFGQLAEERFVFIFSKSSIEVNDNDSISIAEYCNQLTREESVRASKQLSVKEKALLYEALRLSSPKKKKMS